jgi:surfactin family lipopeptide synthetase A
VQTRFSLARYAVEDEAKADSEIAAFCDMLRASFDLRNSLLLRAAIISRKDQNDLLFITAHHLIIDGVSWRILLEDLHTFYNELRNVGLNKSLRKTASLIQWQNKLDDYATSERLKLQMEYWDKFTGIASALPVDFITDDWTTKNSASTYTLFSNFTSGLATDKRVKHAADIPVVMCTALAETMSEWTGSDTFTIEIENHGRHLDDLNSSRTIGWFTVLHPFELEVKGNTVEERLLNVTENFRQIPDHGIGYGVYRYLYKKSEKEKSIADIRLNYLGQFDTEFSNDLFTYKRNAYGSDVAPCNNMTAKLELNIMMLQGHLHVEIKYNTQAHRESTIHWFRERFLASLRNIFDYMNQSDSAQPALPDFDSVDLNQEEINTLFK